MTTSSVPEACFLVSDQADSDQSLPHAPLEVPVLRQDCRLRRCRHRRSFPPCHSQARASLTSRDTRAVPSYVCALRQR